MNVKEKDKSFLVRKSSKDLRVVRSEGNYYIDEHGKKYIDFLSSWNVGNLGWGNREIRAAIRLSKKPDYVPPQYFYKPWTELAQLLAEMTPGKLKRSFRATGGTEAVDMAMQIAMVYTGRKKFISIEGSYHGNSIATLSIGTSEIRTTHKNLLPNCLKINPPLDHKAISKIEILLRKKDVAAFIMEPVIINLGVLIPDKEFMQTLRELCSHYGTLLVLDEVASGFGRTGRLFACEHFNIEPDVMTLGKAITGGYAGMGATITTEKIANAIKDDVEIYSTYGWHPLSVDAAIANLTYIKVHKETLLKNVAEMSDYCMARLSQMEFKSTASIRIKGLAISIGFEDTQYAEKISNKCHRAGLLITAEDERLLICPPVNLTQKVARQALDLLEQCL